MCYGVPAVIVAIWLVAGNLLDVVLLFLFVPKCAGIVDLDHIVFNCKEIWTF
jgi:hypothetical protein